MLGVLPLLAVTPVLVTVSVIDLRTQRIPDRYSIPAFVGCLALVALLSATVAEPRDLFMSVIGAGLMAGTLAVLHAIRPDGLGFGDVKLGLVLGLVIGWTRSSPLDVGLAVSWALALSSAVGLAAVGVVALRGSTVGRSTATTTATARGTSARLGRVLDGNGVSTWRGHFHGPLGRALQVGPKAEVVIPVKSASMQ